MKDRIFIDLSDGVADVRLIRADKMNALDPAMFVGIIAAGDKLAAMKGVRCVVLSGEGKAFCAGLDMASFAAMKDRDKVKDPGGVPGARDLTARTHGIAQCRKPGMLNERRVGGELRPRHSPGIERIRIQIDAHHPRLAPVRQRHRRPADGDELCA